ncbi:MAG TPA: TonB-dependent receptor [Chakrabartia sp.]|jgi:outer membrane receptor protein involved in Fe transport|nr:TonB-dependent receptor [Chakrabartia sp.]
MKKYQLLGATALAMLTVNPAFAQQSPQASEEEESFGNEIIVTAQRQSQSLQNVPIAVSAFSTEALERSQIDNPLELQQALPSTTFTNGNFTGANITIRGVGSPVVAASGDSGVGIHFNDMPLVAARIFETEFYDLERLEVLRGPQGTLFGRNATGGVLNFITAKPDLSGFKASGEAQYGSYDSKQVKGMVNLPIGETLGVRLAGMYLKRDGYTRNLNTGNRIDGRDYYSLRGSLKFEPSDTTRFNITAQYFKEDSNRSRVQKQLCATDTTAILGCRPDREEFGVINGDATSGTALSSREFLSFVAGGALVPFALESLYGDDGHSYDTAINPSNVRQVAIDFEPTYKSDELIIQAEFEQEFGPITVTLNGGYTENSVKSRTDYNLTTTRSVANSPGIAFIRAAAASSAGSPLFAAKPTATAFLNSGLFQGNNICVSEVNRSYVGFIGGQVNRCAANTTEYDESGVKTRGYSLEGRIASDFDGKFNFMLGGLYLNNRVTDSDYFVAASGLDYAALILGGGAGALAPPFYNSETRLGRLKTFGVFGEVYFDLTDNLKITGGLRYSKDKKFISARQPFLKVPVPFGTTDANAALAASDADPSVAGVQAYADQSGSFSEVTGRVVIDWKPTEDNLIYASFTRGYKPGGFNPPYDPNLFPPIPLTFGNELIDAFEVGTKNSFGRGRAQINATAFYYKYNGLQVSRIINRSSFNDNTNATIYGVELEAILKPVRALTFNANLSYLKTKVGNLNLTDTRNPSNGRDDVVIIKDVQSAANCVVAPRVQGSVPIANTLALVNGFNAAASGGIIRPATPVPGTNSMGAFSLCGALGDFVRANTPAGTYMFDIGQGGGQFLPGGVDRNLKGNQLQNSPTWKFSVGVQYEAELSSGWTITPRADLNFTGEAWGSTFNTIRDRLKSYEIVNAQITVAAPESKFYARAFVANLFNNQAVTGKYITDPSSGLFTNIFTVEPRTYGLAAGFKF